MESEYAVAYGYGDEGHPDILALVPPDGRVIGSFGCGFGATEQTLVQSGREVHGADVATEVVATATRRLTSFHLLKPGELPPWREGSLDGLILADVLEHIPQAWIVLQKLVQFVRIGGWVAISVPNMRSMYVLKEFIWRGDWPEHPGGIFDATHLQVMSLKRLHRWCNQCGLKVDRVMDHYDPHGPRRYRFFRTFDLMTLKLFHNWLMFQVQLTARRVS